MVNPPSPPGLIQRYREELQARHYARRTVATYEQWLRRFLRFHQLRHPREMGSEEVNAFLTHLAVNLQVSPSTQNQALSALLFLYRALLERDLDLEGLIRARTRRRLPMVMSVEALVAGLLYGGGLRLMEALRLRVHDVDFEQRQITVRDGKGGKDRRTLLPAGVGQKLEGHLKQVHCLHRQDLAKGFGRVSLPHALARKYPHAAAEWGWQWVFPQQNRWHNQSRATSCAGFWHCQTCHMPHLPPFVRHPPPRKRPRHPNHSRTDGPQRCENNHDLHPRSQPRPAGRQQPCRPFVTQ